MYVYVFSKNSAVCDPGQTWPVTHPYRVQIIRYPGDMIGESDYIHEEIRR